MSIILILALIIGVGGYYYIILDNNYIASKEFYDFPIPKDTKLESVNLKEKGYTWGKSNGTDIPLSYRLIIKKAGWEQVGKDGHHVVYEKNDKLINLTLAPNFLGILELKIK